MGFRDWCENECVKLIGTKGTYTISVFYCGFMICEMCVIGFDVMFKYDTMGIND